MSQLDQTDRLLIAALRRDARSSISNLAVQLGHSRATIKSRIERLISSGIIQRFTIELDNIHEQNLIRAVVMIKLEGSMSRSVIRAVSGLPQVVRIHTTNGNWDMVAEVECETLNDFDLVLRNLREVKGVLGSESCLLLSTIAT